VGDHAGSGRGIGTHASPWARRAVRARTATYGSVAVWFFRLLLLVPFVLMAPEILAAIRNRPDAVSHLSSSTANVLGTSAFLIFVLMLCVTPVHTVTGWRWHIVLRRDYGVAMFAVATTDLLLAATTTGDTFHGGLLNRIGGHTFLLAGLVSTLLLLPMALTANRRAQRWLGGSWKWVQRLTYVVWVTVLIHLLFLFGVTSIFIDAVAVSAPLLLLRVPVVRQWWKSARRDGRRRAARVAVGVVLLGVFAAGYLPLVQELAGKGAAAFTQNPGNG
jgi:sulfoxide reductase heme-binding subunit YedZ